MSWPRFGLAVEAIGAWWARYGGQRSRGADELLILADGGGRNGHRPRLWKARLQERVADRSGRHVTVCHDPTGASKWNPVEHRLFAPVSINRAGQPLRSLGAMLGWVRGTAVGGVGVTASLDRAEYPTKVKVPRSAISRAAAIKALSAKREPLPPMLIRLTPAAASSAAVIDGSAWVITTLTGLVTDETTVRIVSRSRSPGA